VRRRSSARRRRVEGRRGKEGRTSKKEIGRREHREVGEPEGKNGKKPVGRESTEHALTQKNTKKKKSCHGKKLVGGTPPVQGPGTSRKNGKLRKTQPGRQEDVRKSIPQQTWREAHGREER